VANFHHFAEFVLEKKEFSIINPLFFKNGKPPKIQLNFFLGSQLLTI
jgi:hypothetical protein